jgi:hypothetical protein
MNISFNISTPQISTPQIGGPSSTTSSSPPDKTLTVSITTGNPAPGGVDPIAITLSYPLIGPEDIALNEVMQQLKNLDLGQLKGSTLTAAVLLLNEHMGTIAKDMIQGGQAYIEKNAAQLEKTLDGIEKQAKQVETQLFDMINSSDYPDFSAFLSKVLLAAQELRELAATAKHHLVMAQYDNVLQQAEQMKIAAEKNYQSTLKEIEASRTEAIGKIVSGALTIISTGVGGGIGAKTQGVGGLAGAQLGSGIGGAFGQIATGGAELAAADDRTDAAKLKLEADMAGVAQKKLEATQKLLQEAENITEELMNISKTLSDMVLKLYQDFISNQAQIVQRSNI